MLRPSEHGVARQTAMPDDLDAAIALKADVGMATLRSQRRGVTNHPRMLAVMLSLELRIAPAAAIAERYELSGPQSVRNLARQGRTFAACDEAFENLRSRVLRRLHERP